MLPSKMPDSNFEKLTKGPSKILLHAVSDGTPILIRITNKIVIFGNPIAYDKHLNIILKNTTEVKMGENNQMERRKLGNTFIKGTAVQIIINNPTNISSYEEESSLKTSTETEE